MANDRIYFTFPVCLLKDATCDIRDTANNIMSYCGYVQAIKESGSEQQRMEKAGRYFELTWGNLKTAYNAGQQIFNQIPPRSPMTSLNKDIVFDFYINSKTEFEIVCFLAFAAIRSILQTKPYVRITNEYMLARMAGRNTAKDYMPLPELLMKYCNRYQLEKIKTELQNFWGLLYYARYTRGFYVSFKKKMTFEDLVFEVEKRRKRIIEKNRKKEQQQAVRKAFEKLYSTTP
jgi:hypothetical protein